MSAKILSSDPFDGSPEFIGYCFGAEVLPTTVQPKNFSLVGFNSDVELGVNQVTDSCFEVVLDLNSHSTFHRKGG